MERIGKTWIRAVFWLWPWKRILGNVETGVKILTSRWTFRLEVSKLSGWEGPEVDIREGTS